jgi:biopolymer transport protein ExbD
MNMTPMIDVVFQLLTFFMFTLKPIIHEGQFAVNMSTGGAAMPTEETIIPPLAVHLSATPDGTLSGIALGDASLGLSFDRLTIQVQGLASGMFGDIEAEIHADDTLHYEYLIAAVNALTKANITKINFAPGR